MDQLFELLKEYFEQHRVESRRTKGTGVFVPSPLTLLYHGFRDLLVDGIIDRQGLFCDAGCGDGRVVALLSGIFNIPSFGIEQDRELFNLSQTNVYFLKQNHLIPENVSVSITHGDFGEEETYCWAGLRFEEIKTFYNFFNNEHDLIWKIGEQSPKGTVFVLHSYEKTPRQFDHLENLPSPLPELFVYRKV